MTRRSAVALSAAVVLATGAGGRGGRPAAQAGPPPTDIYLAAISTGPAGPHVAAPRNITRRIGYDNQPSFTTDGRALLYTAIGDDGQADTYRYDLAQQTITRITVTVESEYSPTVMPDGRTFSVVRVEADSTQRLWRFEPDGTNPRLLLEDVQPVGYHAWANAYTVALFVLGDPPTLQLADTRTGYVAVVAENIGRSLHKVPGRNAVSFVQWVDTLEAWISTVELEPRRVRRLVRTLPGNEFYTWTPDGAILMGQGSRLFRWTGAAGVPWQPLADFSDAGVHDISRLAVSRDGRWLAIVAADGQG